MGSPPTPGPMDGLPAEQILEIERRVHEFTVALQRLSHEHGIHLDPDTVELHVCNAVPSGCAWLNVRLRGPGRPSTADGAEVPSRSNPHAN